MGYDHHSSAGCDTKAAGLFEKQEKSLLLKAVSG